MVAKTDRAHQGLAEQFASHGADGRLRRAYLAVVWGAPERPSGRIAANLARSTANRTKMAVSYSGGRPAVTHYQVAEKFGVAAGVALAALVRCELETGRTHQIRVHLCHIGHPVMGDATYAAGFATRIAKLSQPAQSALRSLGRQALHAAVLGFEHPVSGKPLVFESPLPADIEALVKSLRDGG